MIDVNLLMNVSNTKRVEKGSVIAWEGIISEEMFIIMSGSVAAFKNYGDTSQVLLENLMPGNFFGERTLFLNKGREATYVALEDTVVMELNKMNAFSFFEKQPIGTYALIMTLCERIDKAVALCEELKARMAAGMPEQLEEEPLPTDTPQERIFPEGHKEYEISFDDEDKKLLAVKRFTCPLCDKGFDATVVRRAALRQLKTDNDLRIHYRNIEPIYYDILTCPHCRFCAFEDTFGNVMSQKADKARRELYRFTGGTYPDFNAEKNAELIFAGHYLALKSAELSMRKPELAIARIWLRLSWLYADCEDPDMEKFAQNKALKAYIDVYQKVGMSEETTQQVCLIIGELSYKTGDILGAKNFLYMAKTNKSGAPVFRNIADTRLSEVKKLVAELTGKG